MNPKLLSTTRGQIIGMLRSANRTVAELARVLHITENGVRAHLTTLERDGLVRQAGVVKGVRKPFHAYQLTDQGEHLFPKSYGPILGELLKVLSTKLSEEELLAACRETGRSLAAKLAPGHDRLAFEQRVALALEVLVSIGAVADLERTDGEVAIQGRSCPIAEAVAAEPHACEVARSLLAEIVGVGVSERCVKGDRPACRFLIPQPA